MQRGLDVGAAHRLDERADDVVVLVAVAVVAHRGPVDGRLQGVRSDGVDGLGVGAGRRLLQVGQRAPGVAARQPQQAGARLGGELVPSGEATRVDDRPVDQLPDVLVGERPQREQQRAGEQRGDHREGRVLRGGRDQRHQPVLDGRQQHVLLGLGEPVHLVHEQDGRAAARQLPPGGLQFGPELAHPRRDGGELHEPPVGAAGDDGGDGRLAHARWPPEEHRHGGRSLGEPPQRRARCEQVLLADDLVQAARPHPHRQRGLGRVRATQRATGGRRPGEVAEQVLLHAPDGTRPPSLAFDALSIYR